MAYQTQPGPLAREAGVVKAELRPGGAGMGRPQLWWSLGDGKPVQAEPQPADPLPVRRSIVPADAPKKEQKPEKKAERKPYRRPREPQPFRAAYWTDGSLIMVGVKVDEDGNAVLPPDHAMQLRRLLAWAPAA